MPDIFETESAFRAAAAERGLELPTRIDADGVLHRCGTVDKPHGKDGAYLLHLDGLPAGGFENHADGLEWQNWCSKAENQMSDIEKREHAARMEASRKTRDEELKLRRARAAEIATGTWESAQPALEHAYLAKKKVKAHGTKVKAAKLLLRMVDVSGNLHSLQTIDEAGEKLFLAGGRKQGCFFPIGDFTGARAIAVAEGFATAASVYEATGIPVAVAFDCGNLKPVAEALHRAYPGTTLAICADDDVRKPGNPGLTHAKAAAAAVGGALVVPDWGGRDRDKGSDFNDLAVEAGLPWVRSLFAPVMPSVARFAPTPSRLSGEAEERYEDARHLLRYGVKFLDDALGGVMRGDLVLIGAQTGAGKSQAAINIAKTNARLGKRVHYFALEARDREMERRMKYQVLAGLYYGSPTGSHRPIRYIDWLNGLLREELDRYDAQAEDELKKTFRNLHTYYRVDSFTSDDFAAQFKEIQNDTDLVVLDHFHFVDTTDLNEIRAVRKLAGMIRDCALRANKPVLVVAHLKKPDAKYAPLIPTWDQFSGASDLVKMATKAIMLAPDYGADTGDPTLWSTFIQIVKCREDGSLIRYPARVLFDVRLDAYRKAYTLGRLSDGGKKFQELEADRIPAWSARPREMPVDTIAVDP